MSVGRAFLTWFLDVFLPWSDVSADHSNLGSDIRAKEDLQGG